MTAIRQTMALLLLGSLFGCGGDALIDNTCDEPQRYQSAAAASRIVPPEGLDPLNERMEMPIPKPKDAPSRPPGSRCIELPPTIGTGK
jgi:hypothetical protein